jgi:hypothetical protein
MAKTPENPNVSDETVLGIMREYALQRRKCDEENGVLRSILKRGKSAGINTKQLIAAHQATKLEPDVVLRDLRDYIRYCALRNMPTTQTDLFGDDAPAPASARTDQQDSFAADDEGYSAGMGGQTADDNPKLPGSIEYVAWEQGRVKGAQAKQNILGAEGRAADASKARPRRGGAIDPPDLKPPPKAKPGRGRAPAPG